MKESWIRLGIGYLYLATMVGLLTPEAQSVLGSSWGFAFAPTLVGGLVAWVNSTRM